MHDTKHWYKTLIGFLKFLNMVIKHCDWFLEFLNTVLEHCGLLHVI